MAKNSLTINGQEITWPFIMKVRNMFKGDWDNTLDAFWKARDAKGQNGIQKYIMCGFIPDKMGKRYMLMPSKERENGQMESIREWWHRLYERHPKTPMVSIKSALKDWVESL